MEKILGTAQFADSYGVLNSSALHSPSGPADLIRLAEESGFSALDTAPSYGDAERIIGGCQTTLRIHTKLDPMVDPRFSLEASLERLNREVIEVAYFHVTNPFEFHDDRYFAALNDLKSDLFESLGVSVYEPHVLAQALSSPLIDVVQLPANPMSGALFDIIEAHQDHGKTIVGRSLLAQGLLMTAARELPERVQHLDSVVEAFHDICERLGYKPMEAVLAWLRQRHKLGAVILAAEDCLQLQDLILSFESEREDDEIASALENFGDEMNRELFDPRSW